MAKRIVVVNKLRPKVTSQGVADLDTLTTRMARQSTTFDEDEMYGMFRKLIKEIVFALQNGETVKLDGLVNILPEMKVGGEVRLALRANRSVITQLNDPALWTAAKVTNHANLNKSSDELVALWNKAHPEDPVED